ncbi:MAG: hypothetical protein ABWZ25_06440 [Chitinophagaceae bacterium]
MILLTNPKKYNTTRIFLLFWGILIFMSVDSKGQGNLLLYPKRIVFEGTKKSQVLNVANTGKDTVRYFISVIQLKMKDDGGFETIVDSDSSQKFADKNFRFFPRIVILGPNESQTVKMQVINMSQLTPGEYRSHLYFRAEPDKAPLGEEITPLDTGSISVKIVAVFGISIPVIIRVGESTTAVTLSDAVMDYQKESTASLKLNFNRTGNMSVYGDIAVDHISLQGKVTRVGIAKGMALYAPNPVRHFNLSLDKNSGINYHKGKLHISYTTQPDAKSEKIAETDLELN